MPDERCLGAMEQRIKEIERRVEDIEQHDDTYATKTEMREAITTVNNDITTKHTSVMSLLQPLHETNIKSKGFISGMFFVVSALAGIFTIVISYLLDHYKN